MKATLKLKWCNKTSLTTDPLCLSCVSAIAGTLIWLPLLSVRLLDNVQETIAHLQLGTILVLVPLALVLVATPNRAGCHPLPYRIAIYLQPGAAVMAVLAFLVPTGWAGALLALPWLLFTLVLAVFGFWRLLPRGFVQTAESCLDMGLLYLPLGGFWLVVSRAGLDLGGLGTTIVLLTAVHYHFVGFIVLVLVGSTGRVLTRLASGVESVFRMVACGVIASPLLVGLGIAFSSLLEIVAVTILTISLLVLAVLILVVAVPRVPDRLAAVLLSISSTSALVTMILALVYAVSNVIGRSILTIAQMVAIHGTLNAYGFTLCGLLGWSVLRPTTLLPLPHPPVSTLAGSGHIGPDFFGAKNQQASGLVDDLAIYEHPDLDLSAIHPNVRAFYERTASYTLLVRPEWRRGFRQPAHLYAALSTWLGQLNLPIAVEQENHLESRFLQLIDGIDGRGKVRAWVRTYRASGRALYIAAYASHRLGSQTYMNIAFPLPGSNLTSILRMEQPPEMSGGLLLTTRDKVKGDGDGGIYLVIRGFPVRVPFNETIRIWAVPNHTQLGALAARHDIWLCGMRFLTLRYTIYPQVANLGFE